ncbi:hypothetical protein Ocin01_05651 [Orchesella cincta]|uniref:Uncharacterized protein n=1 Tax=Orchesella cincta TaxID=48709 RepID=A0A1D2N6Y7_ORCCI|nr:hypothetical protein Ocin01_05651 [Orchesella cincta]
MTWIHQGGIAKISSTFVRRHLQSSSSSFHYYGHPWTSAKSNQPTNEANNVANRNSKSFHTF